MSGAKAMFSAQSWRVRIFHFTPAWYTVAMGTGAVQQALVNFPYPITGATRWMRNLAYCFWILDILLVALFTSTLLARYLWHRELFKKNLMDFPSNSYFGAIPIALNTIILGIISFYDYRNSARWAAFALWWVALVLTVLVSFGLPIIQISHQSQHNFSNVVGTWIMSSVPMIVTASTGATIIQFLGPTSSRAAVTLLIISFMLWAWGSVQSHFIMLLYFWRLVSSKLPPNKMLGSGFLPLAALGQGAYGIHQLSIYLANYIRGSGYGPTQVLPPTQLQQSTLDATAEVIHWMGIFFSLFYLAHATFWLVQASSALIKRRPKSFDIGMWGLTFPIASYANAWAYLSRDLRNDGMRGWAATVTVFVCVLWLLLAIITTWLGLIKGEIFDDPEAEEWAEDDKKNEKWDEETTNGDHEGEQQLRQDRQGGTEEQRTSN